MATVNYTAAACPALLIGQNDVFANNTPSDLISSVGLIQALQDETNTRGVRIEPVVNQSGHSKQVRVFWRQPISVSAVTDAAACDAGVANPYIEQLVTMSMHSHLAIPVAEADIRALCEAYSQYMTVGAANAGGQIRVMREVYENLTAGIDAIRQDMNMKLNVAMAAKLGRFLSPDGGTTPGPTSKTYIFRNVNGQFSGSAVLDGFAKFKQDMRKTTLNGNPIVVGNGLFELANNAVEYGCCNAGGTDFGQMAAAAGYRWYADDYTGTALADPNGLIVFKPGMAHLLTYNKNVGNFAGQIGNKTRGTIADPSVPGLRYDISIVPDECGEFYTLYLDIDYDLFIAPATIFKADDYRTGINGTFKVIAEEQDMAAVPAP